MVKNTWTRIAARWEQNGSFEDLAFNKLLNAHKDRNLLNSLQNLVGFEEFLIDIDNEIYNKKINISNRIKKFVNAFRHNLGSENNVLEYICNTFGLEADDFYGDTLRLHDNIIDFIKDNINQFANLKNSINYIYNTLNNIQVDDDIEKSQKNIILQNIKNIGDKTIKTYDNFKTLVENELKEDSFRPFYFIYNSDKEILTDDADNFENVDYIKENFTEFGNAYYDVQIKKFNSDGDADRWIQNFWSDEYETDDEYKRTWDEYVEENGESPETPSDLGYATLYVGYIKTPKDLKNIESLLTF